MSTATCRRLMGHLGEVVSPVDFVWTDAVATLTRGLARDLGPRGITANAIQPGSSGTDINADEAW